MRARVFIKINCIIAVFIFVAIVEHVPSIGKLSLARPKGQSSCTSCHDKLSETLPKEHVSTAREELRYCLTCHVAGGEGTAFDCIIHSRHYSTTEFEGDCWACHLIGKEGNFKLIGGEGGKEIKATKDVVEKMDCYFRSWATSEHLDHRHAQQRVTCRICHGALFPEERTSMEQCLRCHGTYEHVAALTNDVDPNPHASHYGEMRCTLCHNAHKDSELYCNMCHIFDFEVP